MTSFSGFKGKGFRFDETEAQLADERKKLQKAALGLHDSDEEDAALDVSCSLRLVILLCVLVYLPPGRLGPTTNVASNLSFCQLQ